MKNDANAETLSVIKPEPIKLGTKKVIVFDPANAAASIKALTSGHFVMVEGQYSNGLALLSELQSTLNKSNTIKTFAQQRNYRAKYKKLSNRILVEVKNHKIALKKAPVIGWLEKLYPENEAFLLPYPQIQGLNSSWQWYSNGIMIPSLRNKIHPYYGVYFPTRFDHVILFDNWLKRYEGPKKAAYDIGIGSGVLSLLLVKHGFQKAFGTDTNPNAIIGLQEAMGETKLARKIELDAQPYFGKWDKPAELIVFNPPWLPAAEDINNLDAAIYYDDKLFPTFFEEAKSRLLPDGIMVVLFSNLAKITDTTKTNPIAEEIAKGNRFKLEIKLTRPVKAASDKTKRDQHWRADESVELWVLKHK